MIGISPTSRTETSKNRLLIVSSSPDRVLRELGTKEFTDISVYSTLEHVGERPALSMRFDAVLLDLSGDPVEGWVDAIRGAHGLLLPDGSLVLFIRHPESYEPRDPSWASALGAFALERAEVRGVFTVLSLKRGDVDLHDTGYRALGALWGIAQTRSDRYGGSPAAAEDGTASLDAPDGALANSLPEGTAHEGERGSVGQEASRRPADFKQVPYPSRPLAAGPMSRMISFWRRHKRIGLLVAASMLAVVTLAAFFHASESWIVVEIAALGLFTLSVLVLVYQRIRQVGSSVKKTNLLVRKLLNELGVVDRKQSTKLQQLQVEGAIGRAELAEIRESFITLRRDDVNAPRPATLDSVTQLLRIQYDQIQALMNLYALVDVTAAMPPLRGWMASPDVLLLMAQELLTRRPALVVECGSGSSTVWLAMVIKKHGLPTRLISVDHLEEYQSATQRLLREHGLTSVAEVRLAPLLPTQLPNHGTPWYDASVFEDLSGIGLLFVDGPPAATGPLARMPALPLLQSRLSPDALVVLDDTIRSDEVETVRVWQQYHHELDVRFLSSEAGTAVIRMGMQRE
jgi:predicted O-methyltransferase YrrM